MTIRQISAAALVLAVTATAAWGESVWVKAEIADARGGKGAIYPAVGQVKKGQELTVVSRDGKWVQVQLAGGATGWLNEVSLSTSKVNGDMNVSLGGPAEMSTGVAARGLNPGAEVYVHDRNLNKAQLEHLISLRKSIKPEEYEAFTSQGNVGVK